MADVIEFPSRRKIKPADWDEVENARRRYYPQIPRKAVELLKSIILAEAAGDTETNRSVDFYYESSFYPPEYVGCTCSTADAVWVLDLLDRFGGELVFGEDSCEIVRFQNREPVFFIKRLTARTFQAMMDSSEFRYEMYMGAKDSWRMYSKKLRGSDLLLVFIQFYDDPVDYFMGILDRRTAQIAFSRIEDGTPVEVAMMLEYLTEEGQ